MKAILVVYAKENVAEEPPAGKVAVFGLLKRGGKVYTAIIPNAKTETLLPIIEENVQPDSIVYTDTFKAYNALDVSAFHHYAR
jgi:transposase